MRIVPANFGGKAETYWAFDMGRRMLGEVQRVRRVTLFNCSDGVMIAGSTPRKAAAIDLSHVVEDRDRVLRQVTSEMRYLEAGEVISKIDLDMPIEAFDRFGPDLSERLSAFRGERAEFWDIVAGLRAFMEDRATDYRGVFAMLQSSMHSMVRLGAFFGNRIADDQVRRRFIEHFLTHYEERCLAMVREAESLLKSVREDGRRYLESKSDD